MRSRFIGLLALALVALIALAGLVPVSATQPTSAANSNGKPTCVVTDLPVLNDPTGTEADKYRVMSYIKGCIRASKRGSYISVATTHYESMFLSRALVWANRNGRHVRVIVPKMYWRSDAVKLLRKNLGTDTSKGSYLVLCRNSCVTDVRDGSMHNKLYMFSATGTEQNVTMITSINPDTRQSKSRYNDLYAITDKTIFDATIDYFRQMKYNQQASFPAVVATDRYEMWYMPTNEKRPDFYEQRLNETRCQTTGRAGKNGHTVVNWMSPQLQNTPQLAERAVEMTKRGCKLRILVSLDNTGRKVLWTLKRGDANVRYLWSQQDDYLNHSKMLAISGTHRGDVVNTVYTGTRNAVDSQEVTDNTMLRIINDKVVTDAYRQRFRQVWMTAHPLTKQVIHDYVASQQEN